MPFASLWAMSTRPGWRLQPSEWPLTSHPVLGGQKTNFLGTKLSLTTRKHQESFSRPPDHTGPRKYHSEAGPVEVCVWSPIKRLELGVWEGPWTDWPQLNQQEQRPCLQKLQTLLSPTVIRGPLCPAPCLVFTSGRLTNESNPF